MAFTGKCTFTAGNTLPEIAEDIADLVTIISPHETPLLDLLGDSHRPATSTRHEWFEDALLPNTDTINMPSISDGAGTTTVITVAHIARFRVGDLISPDGSHEIVLVTAINTGASQITVTRGYGATTHAPLTNNQLLRLVSNALLEGQEAPDARLTTRTRLSNYTQIFAATLQVSGSEAAVRQGAVNDEMDYQKTWRLRELLRDLENTVINGVAHDSVPVGSATVRRTMRGLLGSIQTNVFIPGTGSFSSDTVLTEASLNLALRLIWENAGSKVDTILCGGAQKRLLNSFMTESRRFIGTEDVLKNVVSTYESDFGVCRVVLSRFVPQDSVLLLDSSRISVVPLAGRSFQYKPLAVTGDYVSGELVGEYTLECRNKSAHGVIRNLLLE